MRLPNWTEGTTHLVMALTWRDGDGQPLDLSGATLSGRIRDLRSGVTRDVAGVLAVASAEDGTFTWTMAAADVVAGRYHVQFTATYGEAPARTFRADWFVEAAI